MPSFLLESNLVTWSASLLRLSFVGHTVVWCRYEQIRVEFGVLLLTEEAGGRAFRNGCYVQVHKPASDSMYKDETLGSCWIRPDTNEA